MWRRMRFALPVLLVCSAQNLTAYQFGGPTSTGIGSSSETSINGRIVTDRPDLLEHPIEIRLEGFGSEVRARAFTDGLGNFTFGDIGMGGSTFIVVEVDGFKPVRQRVEVAPSFARGRVLTTVFLERSAEVAGTDGPPRTDGDNPNLVDLRQLQARIPVDAVDADQRIDVAFMLRHDSRVVIQ